MINTTHITSQTWQELLYEAGIALQAQQRAASAGDWSEVIRLGGIVATNTWHALRAAGVHDVWIEPPPAPHTPPTEADATANARSVTDFYRAAYNALHRYPFNPNAVAIAGVPRGDVMKRAWQVWSGEQGGMLAQVGVGATVPGEVAGWGAVHFHRHASGVVLVHGPRGMGALAAQQGDGGQTSDPALLAAVQAMLGGDPCNEYGNPAGNPAVRMFQVAWNGTSDGSMGSPKLTVDGKYGPNTASAAAQANGSMVPAPCKVAPPPPNPQPQPQPQPQPTPATPTNWVPWVLGGVGVIAVLGVGYAVLAKPSSKELKAHAKHHDRTATHHRLHARHLRHAAHAAAREESASEAHRRRRAREESRRRRARELSA